MQNPENTASRISSTPIWPVSLARACAALRNSSPRSSGSSVASARSSAWAVSRTQAICRGPAQRRSAFCVREPCGDVGETRLATPPSRRRSRPTPRDPPCDLTSRSALVTSRRDLDPLGHVQKFRVRCRGDGDDQIGPRGTVAGPAHALGLDLIFRVAQPGGVGQMHRHAAEIDPGPDNVARGAGNGGDDGDILPGQCVHQCRLAGIGRPQDDEFQPLAQPFRRRGGRQGRVHFLAPVR